MKKLLYLASILLIGVPLTCSASELVLKSSSVINRVLAAGTTQDLDLNANLVDALSVQVVYSSANAQALTFTDGNTSTGSITVNTLSGLTTAYASNTITISSNTAVAGSWLFVSANGYSYYLTEGRDWTMQTTASATAINLMTALNSKFSGIFISTVSPIASVIYSTASTYGSAGNAFSMLSSTQAALKVNTATFVGGQDAAYFRIGNQQFTAYQQWFPGTTAALTATNIRNAISTSPVSAVITSTANGNIVYTTSTVVGSWTNFTLLSSTPTALIMSGPAMLRGADSDVVYSAYQSQSFGAFGQMEWVPAVNSTQLNSIQKTTTSWGAALPVLLGKTAGTYPSPLLDKTTYYVTNLTSTGFQLSDTSTGSVAGLTLTLSTATLTGGGTFTLTPLALSGTPSFKLQMSDDGTNFSDVFVSTSALLAPFSTNTSFASPYTASNVLWNLGNVYYKILRFVYTAATAGGTNINWIVNGKKFAN